jgi:hypothetical protein
VHHVADELQRCAQFAAWMKDPEVDRGKAATFKKGNRQGVAQRELHQ